MAEDHVDVEKSRLESGNPSAPTRPDAIAPSRPNGQSATSVPDDEIVIDWDVKIEVPPPRPSQTVTARFIQGGRRPLRVSNDPQD
jgi:hypothetical protein